MITEPITKADKAREARTNYGMAMPSLKLARILYAANPLLFKNVEEARSALRYAEGKHGNEHRKFAQNTDFFVEAERPKNPYNLPESYQEKREPFHLPPHCNNILLISDLHIPYHDIQAVTLALDYGVQKKCNTIFINGDLIDFATISRFEKDFKKRSVKQEFEAAKDFLVVLRNTFPTADIYWLKGNHCTRLEKFLAQKACEIWDDPYFHLEERLALHEQKVKLLDDTVLVKAGKLNITHGHHIFKGVFAPVNPARGAYLKAKASVIVGHLHRASHDPEIDIDGKVISCWSTGCLCELRPGYNPLVSNSQHGFAHITIEEDGRYRVSNFQIIDGELR